MKFGISNKKAGVSLVTVLLFMLVATIAATATYKWLTSENRSSGTRLQRQMAYQSAVAGIDNARAWMTFHANDVGALIKQYKDGNYAPINLDANLRSLQRPGQNHHVWLVGANTENSTYKLKILSSGEASGGARHSEVAIFNVSGLYQVSLPVQQGPKKKIPFDYAYFGGSYDGAGSLTMTSAIVNGNWYGNPQGIEKKFVVTGNATLTGNNVSIGSLACVGGNMSPENNGLTGADVYVGKTFTGNINASGNVYFGGDVNPSSAGNFNIGGHVTLMGNMQTVQSAKNLTIGGDLCLAENAHILSKGTNYTFESKGNVWMPGKQNIWYGSMKYSNCSCERVWCNWMGQCQPKTTVACTGSGKKMEQNGWEWGNATYTLLLCANSTMISDGDNYSKYDKIVLGGKDKTVYIKSGHLWSDYSSLVTSKTFVETKDEKIMCRPKPGVARPDASHEYCNTDKDGKVGPAERWDGATYSPYDAHTHGSTGSFEGMSYIYYLEPGQQDVEFKTFNDSYWILCNKWDRNLFLTEYCAEPASEPGVDVLTYFVDGERFWDGYDGVDHPRRTLNYEDGKPTGSPYCTSQGAGGPGNEKMKYRPKCGVTPWFKTNATKIENTEPAEKFKCAAAVKDSCDVVWEKKPGCGGSDYKVDDVLVTARAAFEPFASKGCAANITKYDKNLVTNLNNCYKENNDDATKREKNLYNGYLVVKVSGGTNSTNPTGTLDGKFIIIARDAIYSKLPQTESGTRVLLYLEKGANTLNDVTVSNYFIYTEGNIGSGNQFNLNGTIYATAESCAGLGKLQSSSITYNQDLVNDLSAAGVICPNDGSVCGGAGTAVSSGGDPSGSTTGEGGEESSTTGGTDAYYISMAPQLGVTLESQYENDEPLPAGNNQTALDPSFIVLPRIIYLPDDPFGELKDYYNVIPLNGSALKKSDVSVSSCIGVSGSISASGKLYSGVSLSHGIYTCTAKAGGYNDVPFWVVVGNSHRNGMPITFLEPDQKIAAGGTKEVHVVIPSTTPAVELLVNCPVQDPEAQLTYTLNGGTRDGTTCKFNVQGDASGSKSQLLFTVSAKSDATTGSLMFQLLSGTGYNIGSPYTSEVYMASLASLERLDATPEQINTFCEAHAGVCPPEGKRSATEWPDCPEAASTTETWVEPTGITYGIVTKNKNWNLVVGGAGTVQLLGKDVTNCVTIVPDESINIATINVNDPQYLHASLKAVSKKIRLDFVGDIEGSPVIDIYTNSTKTGECKYNSASEDKSCYISAYSGQQIELYINKETYPQFNYWDCSGASCPTTEAISSTTYNAFTIKDDNSVIYAHFNETDKHCFFEEFRSGDVRCTSVDKVYCIDKCGSAEGATCEGVGDVTDYTKSKWHLISGKLEDIDEVAGSISLRRNGRTNVEPVTVMSTVNAGTYGTLKALFQLPKETPSHNRNTIEILKSGFLLHSNTTGSEYLMLNLFANQSGYLEAQLCTNNGNCLSGTLLKNGSPASVYASSMIMMSATIGVNKKLAVSAFTGNYYGSPDEYSYEFDLESMGSSYMDVAHEFVGFSLADPNFKLYGVGWISQTYSAECYDTPPIVKCSFAAVATNGVVPIEKKVKPWVGHSGWFDSESCIDEYYYYNGSDLQGCVSNSNAGTGCGSDSLIFDDPGVGNHSHGYTENVSNKEMRTVKALLSCTASSTEKVAWASTVERAHCGPFWTGKFNECKDHANLVADQTLSIGLETTVTMANPVNLRATRLTVQLDYLNVMDDGTGIDVEFWLISDNSGLYDSGDTSRSVIVTSKSASFSVDSVMSAGATGFDPEHVKWVVFKNRGSSDVKVVSLVASCKNAVDITSCNASYADGKWTVEVGVNDKDKVSTFGMEAKVDGATVLEMTKSSAEITFDENKAILEKADNPYAEYQDKTYVFFASIVNKSGSTASMECNSVLITPVTRSCSVPVASKKQGEGLPQFNINLGGCPSEGCSYEVYIGGTMLEGYPKNGSGTIDPIRPDGNGKNGDGTEPSSGSSAADDYAVGTYRYTVKSPEGATHPFADCYADFQITKKEEVNNSALKTECWFDNQNALQPGADAYFKAYDKGHGYDISGHQYEVRTSSGSVVGSGTAPNNQEILTVKIDGGANTIADGVFKLYIKDGDNFLTASSCKTDPTLDVEDLSPSCSINNDGQFQIDFTGNICANNVCKYEVKKTVGSTTTSVTNGEKTLSQNTVKESISGYGNYVLWLNGSATTCSQKVQPDVKCPTLKRVYTLNQQANLLMSDLKNCGSGCDYDLVVNGSNVKSVSDGSYSSASTAIPFTPTLELDNVDYTFTVYAKGDHTLTDNCSGKMQFVAGSTCTAVEWAIYGDNSNDSNYPPNPKLPWKNSCATITTNRICTGEVQIKAPVACENHTGKWNGVDFQLQGNGPPTKTFSTNPAPMLVNNVEINDCNEITFVYMTGCTEVSAATSVPTIANCPSSSIVAKPNTNISLPMTISNCKVIGGCSYSISASGYPGVSGTTYGTNLPTLSGASVDKTTVTYTLSVSNSQGNAATCTSFEVYYDSDSREERSISDNVNVAFGPGKYRVSCNGKGSTMTVQPQQQTTECSSWFESTITFVGGPWNNCDWQASAPNPVDFTVPDGKTLTLKCY